MGEQPNPWDLLQPQDVTSRHRGAKPYRRYELLGRISLLSPEYLLSFERHPSHVEMPDHLSLLSHLFDPSVFQSSTLLLIRSSHDYQPCWGYLCEPPLRFRRRPPQSNYPPHNVLVAELEPITCAVETPTAVTAKIAVANINIPYFVWSLLVKLTVFTFFV